MEFIKQGTKIDFMKYRGLAVLVSAILMAICAFGLLIWPRPNAGIDFSGGAELTVLFKQPVDVGELRRLVESLDLGETRVQETEGLTQGQVAYLIRVEKLGIENQIIIQEDKPDAGPAGVSPKPAPGPTGAGGSTAEPAETSPPAAAAKPGEAAKPAPAPSADKESAPAPSPAPGATAAAPKPEAPASGATAAVSKPAAPATPSAPPEPKQEPSAVEKKLAEKYGADSFEIVKTDFVGPRVGEQLQNAAINSIVLALFLLLIYITLRFDFRFAVGAILALIHDVLITAGAFVWTGREFNLTIIAALLTIIGYSLNDTIVICDRVRENLRKQRRIPFVELINIALNETLSRTILTSFTVFIVVLCLFILGGSVIHDFAFAMLVGCISGTYSTVFITSAFVVWWESLREQKRSPVVETKP